MSQMIARLLGIVGLLMLGAWVFYRTIYPSLKKGGKSE